MRDKRKNPYEFKRWYLVHYQSQYYLWSIIVLIFTLVYFIFSKWVALKNYEEIPTAVWIVLILGVSGIVIRVITTIKNYQDGNYLVRYDEDFKVEDVQIPKTLTDSGYEKYVGGWVKNIFDCELQLAGSASSKMINEQLWEISNKNKGCFRIKLPTNYRNNIFYRRKWRMPVLARIMLFGVLKKLNIFTERVIANETKVRLKKDLLMPLVDREIHIEKTDYISDLLTGQITGAVIYDKDGGIIYNGYDFSYKAVKGVLYLKTCAESQTSCQIGASSLILGLTKDNTLKPNLSGHIAIIKQGGGNLQSGGLLAPSGSGSIDWSDYFEYKNRMIMKGMHRELFEETKKGSWESLIKNALIITIITGFGRMLHRGGKPEFYGLVIMPRNLNQYDIDKTETRYVNGFEWIDINPVSAENVIKCLNDYKDKNINKLSHPLFMCIELTVEYLTKNVNSFDKMINEVSESLH